MSSREILDLLKLLLALPFRSFWSGIAALLDRMRGLDGFWSGLLVVTALAIPAVLAFRLQKRLIRTLTASPGASLGFLPFLKMELWHSVFALPLWPFQAVRLAFRALRRGGRALVRRRKAQAKDASAPAGPPPPQASPPVLIATLGPGFLLAGLVTAGFYLAARAAEPLLRSSLDLSPGLSAWQYLFLGRRPELEWYLPLDRFPFLAGLLTVLLWLAIWSFVGICVRLAYRAQLGRNLADARHDETVLPAWRRWSGVPFLVAPVRSYREWAGWLLVGAVPLLLWAWLSLAGDPYRLRPSELAVALVLWTSWSLHLKLRGEERLPLQAEAEEPTASRANGWPEVLAHLERELRIGEPEPFEMRPVERLPLSEVDPRTAGILSPLLAELLPPPRKLTPMQRTVLTRLALQGFVHVEPPVALDQLQLGDSALDVLEDRSGQRSSNLIVLAPEGSGKTTLALLAVANHALVHTRASLIVVRSEDAAARLAERFRRAIEPSTLRWNVRVRLLGADLMTDLAQGIAPDVVVCSLHGLVTTLLDRSETFSPFLRNLGLVLIDDVEAFLGPVEVHAQLAFRRLSLRVAELSGARELGEKARESAAQVLVVGTDSMHRMPEWVRHLCGIDAVARTFSHSAREAGERDAAALAAAGNTPARPEGGEETPTAGSGGAAAVGRHHRFYRLRDFRSAAGEPLTFAELIGACERLAVPWHYRLCGDAGRTLGRGPLLLRDEPEHFTESPEEACVLLLEGSWSEVRRERRRLARAGGRFRRVRGEGREREEDVASPEPIAFVTRVDSDEEMALTQLDKRFSLAPEIDTLPRPVLRPPTGLAVDPHLGAELVQHWLEVEDVVRVFGGSVTRKLRTLAAGGMLLCERRTDVDERASEHVEHVHVRALARAIRSAGEREEEEEDLPGLLPPKVAQVELTARRSVAVRDRTGLSELGRADAASAHLSYYPGRIFQDARGVFVVVGRAADEAEESHLAGDVLVEPLLSDEVSSPRRTFRLRTLDSAEGIRELLENAGGAFPEPDVVLIGKHPFRLALAPIEVAADHVATYRLGVLHSEIRQRTLLDRSARERYRALSFPTVGLTLFPNPDLGPAESQEATPKLTLEGARLLAAALRTLLPSIVRGAALDLRVAVRLDHPEKASADHVLGPSEGVSLFDAEAGGNGAARAIHRDGLELLLRLSRLLIERVLSYDRLRALHDEWGSKAEILAESRNDLSELSDGSEVGSERDVRARREALIWLDSRLRPEGGVESWQGAGLQSSGSEQGEGDVIDLGRCWYSRDGAVTDLLWAKHRWRQPSGREAVLDLAFDRDTAAEARRLPGNARLLAAYAADYAVRLDEDPGRRAPREVWFLAAGGEAPQRSLEGEPPEPLRALHALLAAAASHSGQALSQLAAALRDRCAEAQDRRGLASYLAAFVQGIPFSVGGELRPPVSTLLYRLGDAQAKGLLLATLLDLCGIGSGLFVSLEEGHTVVAAALPQPLPAGDAAATVRHLAEWSAAAGLAEPPRFWGELPEGEERAQLYVPIEATAYCPVGLTVAENPRTWAFLPLTLLERRLDLDRLGPAPTDRAEHESRF